MPSLLEIVAFGLVFDDDNLAGAVHLLYLAHYLGALDVGLADGGVGAVINEKHAIEIHFVADFIGLLS